MAKRRFGKSEIWMFVGAALTLVIMVAAIVLSLGFMSTNLYRALSPGEHTNAVVYYDIAGYNALGLQ